MGEYDAKQRNQLGTLIVNGNTGSKQLKGFVDNRCTTQKVASQIKVIQKVSIDKWCQGVKETQDPTITLYSYICYDGVGDAGQLGYLFDKVSSLGFRSISYAIYSPRNKAKPSDMRRLARIDNKDHLKKNGDPKIVLSPTIDEKTTWEIQYPVPHLGNAAGLEDGHILKVSEMNQMYDTVEEYHTGIAKAKDGIGIGYGIPKYIPKSDDESNLRDKFIEYKIISDSEPDLPCLKDAWLVKVNEGQSVVDILKKAKEMGCTFLILLGKLDKQQQADYSNASIDKPSQVHKIESLEQSVLSCLMSKIGCDGGTGMIFAGGEGMYVQALGASEAAVGDVIRDGYSYQTEQIKADSKKKADDENSSDSAVINFNTGENLGMMDIPQQELKAHSDWVRQSEHNWFNKLDGISFWDKAYTLYRWFISSPIPGYFEYFGEPINKDEFSSNYFTSFMEARTGNIAAKEAFRHIVSELVNIKCLYEKGAISDPHQDECD